MFGTCPGLLSRPVGRPSFRISAVAVVFVVLPAIFLYSGSDLTLHDLPSNSNSAGKVICGTGRSDLSTVSESRKLNFGTLPKTLFFLLFSVYRAILAVAPLCRSRYPFFVPKIVFRRSSCGSNSLFENPRWSSIVVCFRFPFDRSVSVYYI